MEQQTGSKWGKEYIKAVLSPCLLTYMHSTSCKMPHWWTRSRNQEFPEKYQQPWICRWYHSNGWKQRGTKEPLKVKEESEKADLKLNIQTVKIMASDPIISWKIDGATVETVTDLIFSSSKITADGDCSQEIKRCLLLGRKAMRNLDSILKGRDITLPIKVHTIKSYGFSSSHIWMWELDHR